MILDDGRGPRAYCKRGRSYCEDQQCDCVDTTKYRALYRMAREYRGWDHPSPFFAALWFTACTLLGVAIGLAVVVAYGGLR